MLRESLYVLPVFILYGIRKYIESKWGKCKNKIQLDGKVAIVTGANSGIGFEVAKEFAARNANVILACRSLDNANKAIAKIKAIIGRSVTLIPMELDLASLQSIERFVANFKKNHDKLHILVNNAGVSYPKAKRETTKDGLEIHFGVNHLGHFHLTKSLLDTMEDSKPSRVILVSSKLHEKGVIHLDDLYAKNRQNENFYSNSKLANVYFCRELAIQVRNKGIQVFAVCPGWIYTNLFRHSIKWFHYLLIAPIAFFFMRNAKQGAQTIIYCATEPGLETGLIYRDCKMYESKHKFDSAISTGLWNKCEDIIKQIIR